MSILLSLYTKDGIVFAADKNLTLSEPGTSVIFEGDLTKVLLWPNRTAVIGFVGLAELEGILMEDWLRLFIAETRQLTNLEQIADLLRQRLDSAFVSLGSHDPKKILMIHLGGFNVVDGYQTPMMHTITNIPALDGQGGYLPAVTHFMVVEEFRKQFENWNEPSKYPEEVRQRLTEMEDRDHFLWFNNGDRYPAFNAFKGILYHALKEVRSYYSGANSPRTLFDWQAYAKMAVELHGLYYRHNLPPDQRVVGGGVDMCSIPWPDQP